jgi:hypothetical protein
LKVIDIIENLIDHFIVEYDFEIAGYQLHPLIKEYFLSSIPFTDKVKYHEGIFLKQRNIIVKQLKLIKKVHLPITH